ncbi:glycosyltransferase [Natrarchaeobius halalkaliphilus]|uniref:Glycosyltransferase n=1 Tax=Natrarchaeobius halalkaliphilus TaxID=1679091 RepID=A0A3N6MC09_9EURY|nr:glycosyltransferase family 4 protein [Natrarchaeobius halalkaliphilus]RQG93021.1 glycosyltransferase [Natrarchaeobius halalkaliphilus]
MTDRPRSTRIAICSHFSLEHYRGGEKWVAALANLLSEDGFSVEVRTIPYSPGGVRRVSHRRVLDPDVSYAEAWHHDLSGVSSAYMMYAPGMRQAFRGSEFTVAGIHSWAFVSPTLVEPHYSPLHNGAKLFYRLVGERDLARYDRVHTVTPAFDGGDRIEPVYVPNFVDRRLFRPNRRPLADEFQVLVSAANVHRKGWDLARRTASLLEPSIRLVTTGTSDSPHVTGLGFLSERELADAYARSHAVLHPARVDTDSMVINEAGAAGTPVVTTPLETHVRENEAVLHAGTPRGMASLLEGLRSEWEAGEAYERRCRYARETSESRDVERVYPALKSLLLERADPEVGDRSDRSRVPPERRC